MQFKIPHKTTRTEAISRIKNMLKEHEDKIAQNATNVKTEWKDNVLDFEFTAQGTHITGKLTVTENEFDVYAKLPLMYRLFEGRIEKMIAEEMKKMGI
jgi:hypothetical protein